MIYFMFVLMCFLSSRWNDDALLRVECNAQCVPDDTEHVLALSC